MADKDVPYTAPWAPDLKHRPDPNRVHDLHTPSPGQFSPRPAGELIPPDPATVGYRPAPPGKARQHDPQSVSAEPSYYDISMLQAPPWKWEIAGYFFVGGLAAGAYVLGRAAGRFGNGRFRHLEKMAAYTSFVAILPAPPLLIHDLGDAKRFHHMLRVWKPTSPMNLGTWALTAFGGMAGFEAIRHYLEDHPGTAVHSRRGRLLRLMNDPAVLLLHDLAGIPFALLVASYTGVLLSSTANPMWCKNLWLSPLFTASAISTGAEAVSLALDLVEEDEGPSGESPSHRILRQVDSAAHAAEGIAMAGYLRTAGERARPLRTGRQKACHHFAVGGIVAAEVLKALPLRGRPRKTARVLASALGLAAGFAMRWAFVYGGHEAANDPKLARLASSGSPRNRVS